MPQSKVEFRKFGFFFFFLLHRKCLEAPWNCVWLVLVRGEWAEPQNTEGQIGERYKQIGSDRFRSEGLVCPTILVTEEFHTTAPCSDIVPRPDVFYSCLGQCESNHLMKLLLIYIMISAVGKNQGEQFWQKQFHVMLHQPTSTQRHCPFLPLISIMLCSELWGWKLVHSCLHTWDK